jgi:SAM-dependent methyltransferase
LSQLEFDQQAAEQLEAIYLKGDAVRRRGIVRRALAASPGERVLDVGCGPGFYCAELLEEVGHTGSVVGVDGSPAMLALAARRCGAHPNVELLEGDAVSLPVEDATFDAALSVQVQEYVADATAGMAELHRALRPGGRALVFDSDWDTLSLQEDATGLTDRVLRAWDEHLAHRSLPRTLAGRLRAAGFEDVRMTAYPFATIEFDDDSYGAGLTPFIGAFVAGRQGITEEEADAWVAGQRRLGERGDFYFAITSFCFTARKGAQGESTSVRE